MFGRRLVNVATREDRAACDRGRYRSGTNAPLQTERKLASGPDPAMHSRRGTVLIVENTEAVASVLSDYFARLGYSVDYAASGSEALRKMQARRSYDLVFSDILMLGSVAGLELARILRAHHSEVPILLTTGFSEKAQEAVAEDFSVLQKPDSLQRLSQAVREVRSNFQ